MRGCNLFSRSSIFFKRKILSFATKLRAFTSGIVCSDNRAGRIQKKKEFTSFLLVCATKRFLFILLSCKISSAADCFCEERISEASVTLHRCSAGFPAAASAEKKTKLTTFLFDMERRTSL